MFALFASRGSGVQIPSAPPRPGAGSDHGTGLFGSSGSSRRQQPSGKPVAELAERVAGGVGRRFGVEQCLFKYGDHAIGHWRNPENLPQRASRSRPRQLLPPAFRCLVPRRFATASAERCGRSLSAPVGTRRTSRLGAAAHPANQCGVGKAVLRARCIEPIDIYRIGQLATPRQLALHIRGASAVDRVLPAVLLLTWHGDHQAPLSARRHRGASVRGGAP